MKNNITLQKPLLIALVWLVLFTQSIQAQITLPFQTGFNTAVEQNQWTQYRIGDTSLSFNKWEFFSGPDPALTHGYPVGGTETTNDWMVSEEFDFSAGAIIDSIRFKGAGFGLPFGNDTVALYVIEGHQHPDSATNQVLLKLFTDSTYNNDNAWKTFRGISIPEISGPVHLAFRYQTIVNWLDVDIDDLSVSSAISGLFNEKNKTILNTYPNPVQDNLFFHQKDDIKKIELINAQGQIILCESQSRNSLDVSFLTKGIYFIQVETQDGFYVNRFIKQ